MPENTDILRADLEYMLRYAEHLASQLEALGPGQKERLKELVAKLEQYPEATEPVGAPPDKSAGDKFGRIYRLGDPARTYLILVPPDDVLEICPTCKFKRVVDSGP
jgi:hypothetical protein